MTTYCHHIVTVLFYSTSGKPITSGHDVYMYGNKMSYESNNKIFKKQNKE